MIEQVVPQIYNINATASNDGFVSEDSIGTNEELLAYTRNGVPIYVIMNCSGSDEVEQLIFRVAGDLKYDSDSTISIEFSTWFPSYGLTFNEDGTFSSCIYTGR